MTETYASVDRLQEYTQVEATDLSLTSDEFSRLCEALLGSAKDQIDAYTGRQTWGFDLHDGVTISLDGKNGDRKMLNLPHPVHSVSTVKEGGSTLAEGDEFEWKEHGSLIRTGASGGNRRNYGVGGASSRLGQNSSPPGLQSKQKAVWSAGYNNVEVTLTFGYYPHPDDPTQGWSASDPALPRDILKAELKLADHELQGLLSKRENTTIQTDEFEVDVNTPVSMTKEVQMDLEQYKDRRGGG
jgi:frataxin-like iron-binding protein CyaY